MSEIDNSSTESNDVPSFAVDEQARQMAEKALSAVDQTWARVNELNERLDGIEPKIQKIEMLPSAVESLNYSVQKLTQDMSNVKTESANTKRDCDKLQGRFTTLEGGFAGLKSRVDTLEQADTAGKLKEVEKSVVSLKTQVDADAGKITALTGRVDQLEKDVTGKIKQLTEDRDGWRSLHNTVDDKYEKLKQTSLSEIRDLKNKWDADKEQAAKAVSDLIAQALKMKEEFEKKIDTSTKQLDSAETKIGVLDKSLTAAQGDSMKWKQRFDALEKKYLKDKVVQ